MPKLFLAVGLLGLLCSSIYSTLALIAASDFVRRRRSLADAPSNSLPKLSLLKPLHGDEPDLESRLEGFFEQDYPSYEILFCARDRFDPGLRLARRVAERHPNISAQFLTTGEPAYINAKVSSLQSMAAAAASEILVISDSDVRVARDYLSKVTAPFADPRVGLVTCLYRGVADGKSLWSRLEATAMSVEMAAGVLVADRLEGMQFALGPTMAARRACVEEVGGFGALGRYCADDFVLGNRIAANGHRVELSGHVVDHIVLNEGFFQSIRHQIRWMKSTRFSRPKGHLGTVLTFSVPYGLLAFCAFLALRLPQLGILALVWSIFLRMALAIVVGGAVVGETNLARIVLLYPLRDLMGFFFWAGSYASNQILWRGEVFELSQDGVMRRFVPEAMPNPIGKETLLPPQL